MTDLRMLEQIENLIALFNSLPGAYLILSPDDDFTILAVDDAYLQATNTIRDRIVGRPLFEVFPDDPQDIGATGVHNLTESLRTTIREKKPHKMPVQKYNIPQPGSALFQERYWSPINTAVMDKDGNVICIIHHVSDVTEYAKLEDSFHTASNIIKESSSELINKVKKLQELNALLIQREAKMSQLKEENVRLQKMIVELQEKIV